jgi:hypothetical protein
LKNNVFNTFKCVKKLISSVKQDVLDTLELSWILKTQISKSFINNLSKVTVSFLKICQSSEKMLALTIYLMLLRQNVESNPGMNNNKQGTFSIISNNGNGLRKKNKLRRLTRKITPIIKKGGIVLLQETHLPDTNYLKTIWKEKFESNCVKSNSAGVLTFFNNEYETVEVEKDSKGRFLILVLKNQDKKLIVANSYFPNDHRIAIDFAETVYLKILEMQHKYPEYLTIAGSDYNVCMNPNDSLNRN